MNREEFVAAFGAVFEHSPWIAEAVWRQGPPDDGASARKLHPAFAQVIRESGRARQLELLRAHPELAVGVARGKDLTRDSEREQRGAGLDRCSPEEFDEFRRLNREYRAKFGFPFILAVKGLGRQQILQAFRTRSGRSEESEFDEAVEQVIRIGGFRLDALFESRGRGG